MIKKSLHLAAMLMLFISVTSFAQVWNPNPAATHNLGSGSYSFTSWAPTNAAGTYPAASVIVCAFGEANDTSTNTTLWDCAYNLTSRSRIVGKTDSGFVFNVSGTAAGDLCTSATPNAWSRFPMGMVTQLSATGRQNLKVSYGVLCYQQSDGNGTFTNRRNFQVSLQFRIGNSGAWTTISSSARNAMTHFTQANTIAIPQRVNLVDIPLPSSCDNQAIVQIRIRNVQANNTSSGIFGAGTRPAMGFDDVVVTSSTFVAAAPTKLVFDNVNSGVNPTENLGFDVTIKALDAGNLSQNVAGNTTIDLSVASGAVSLTGTTSGVMLAGTNTLTISGVKFDTYGTGVSLTATDVTTALTAATSATFDVNAVATKLALSSNPSNGFVNSALPTSTVFHALRPDNTLDNTYNQPITLTILSGPAGGVISGVTTINMVNGIGTYFNANFYTLNVAGNYILKATSGSLTTANTTSISILNAGFFGVIVPRYIVRGATSDRIPVAMRLTVNGLKTNTVYRYANTLDTVGPVSTGAGNVIYYNPLTQTYNRATTIGLAINGGGYGEFTTNGSGSYTGWFLNELTSNARFIAGKNLVVRLRLNDGNNGTTTATTLSTTQVSQLIELGSTATKGTMVYSNYRTAKNFVAIYDDTNPASQPYSCSFVASSGIDFSAIAEYNTTFKTKVAGQNGFWAGWLPNVAPNGIKLIREFDAQSGLAITNIPSSTGVWATKLGSANTVNPTQGSAGINLEFDLASTKLNTNNCGKLDYALVQVNVGNAKGLLDAASGATGYETFFYNDSLKTQLLATYKYIGRNVLWSNVVGLEWTKTYWVTARANFDEMVGPFGPICKIGFRANPVLVGIATTGINDRLCGTVREVNPGTPIIAAEVPGATAYQFAFYSDSTATTLFTTSMTRGRTLIAGSVTPSLLTGTEYWVRVRAYIGLNVSNWGAICKINIYSPPTRGAANLNITTYPNPFSNTINLTFNNGDNSMVNAKILDMSGRVLESIKLRSNEIVEVGSTLPAGLYFVEATTESGLKSVTKIVKQ